MGKINEGMNVLLESGWEEMREITSRCWTSEGIQDLLILARSLVTARQNACPIIHAAWSCFRKMFWSWALKTSPWAESPFLGDEPPPKWMLYSQAVRQKVCSPETCYSGKHLVVTTRINMLKECCLQHELNFNGDLMSSGLPRVWELCHRKCWELEISGNQMSRCRENVIDGDKCIC